MGRTRTKSKKVAASLATEAGSSTSSPSKSDASGQPTVKSLLSKAQSLVSQCDYDLAMRFIERILHKHPNHVETRELLGIVQVEIGEVDLARETFTGLLPPSPNAPPAPPPAAHLYLAQLTDDDPRQALAHYQAAVDIFVSKLDPNSASHPSKQKHTDGDALEEETVEDLKKNLVRTLIAMVEIWMDPAYDLCFEPTAEQTCESLLNLALHSDPNNPEAQQSLASVRLSQNRPEEALSILLHAYASWRHLVPSILPSDDVPPPDASISPLIPPIPTRLAMTRYFLELGRYTEALEVIQSIMGEDDEEVEAWYLEGWCFWLMAEKALEAGGALKVDDGTGFAEGKEGEKIEWKDLARDARDCLDTCEMMFLATKHPDAPLLEHARELIAKLQEAGVEKSEDDDEEEWGGIGGGETEDWEDDDDDDVDMK
ncbi:hypothetical protein BDV98DRAFT_608921 [Pterulicium gracile]|uniref:Uncharacterized protein n=1 Tax=Pterulicium gracile TaxID=1884261 RepID=A0A5C3Q5J8_9AGAR|nr:hypothetical protein BDV98DRAFT_608921 [Pterula gracilis]